MEPSWTLLILSEGAELVQTPKSPLLVKREGSQQGFSTRVISRFIAPNASAAHGQHFSLKFFFFKNEVKLN